MSFENYKESGYGLNDDLLTISNPRGSGLVGNKTF